MKKGDLILSNVYTSFFPEELGEPPIDIEVGQKARLLTIPIEITKDREMAWIELVGGPHDGLRSRILPITPDWEYAESRNISEKNI
jgi:hypothetical protein